jgi:hypothetical protein
MSRARLCARLRSLPIIIIHRCAIARCRNRHPIQFTIRLGGYIAIEAPSKAILLRREVVVGNPLSSVTLSSVTLRRKSSLVTLHRIGYGPLLKGSLDAIALDVLAVVPHTALRLRLIDRCPFCGAVRTVVPETTIKGESVLLTWCCRTCSREWPVTRAEYEASERRVTVPDRRQISRSDRGRRSDS